MLKLLVIIPAYNEEKTISSVVSGIPASEMRDIDVEILVIDDGSVDETSARAMEAGATVISHSHNLGLGIALKTGLQYALENAKDIVVNIDADLQFDPAEIPQLIKPIVNGKADFVAGNRFPEVNGKIKKPDYMSKIKFWGNHRMTELINWLTGTHLKDVSSGFRAYSREAILNLNLSGKYTVSHETIMDLAFKQFRLESVPVAIRYFPDRESRVAGNLFQYVNQALRIITRAYRDYKPLRFFFYFGLPPMIVGSAALIFMLVHYILTGDFTPYKFIGFGGIYLASLGILLWIIGFLSDILVGIRMTQEKQLYFQKKQYYENEGKK